MKIRKKTWWKFIALFVTFAFLLNMNIFSIRASAADNDDLLPDSFQIYLDGNAVVASFSYSVEPEWFEYATLQYSDTEDGPYEDTEEYLYYYELSTSSANIIRYIPENSGGTQYYRLKCVDIVDEEEYTEPVELTLPVSAPDDDSNLPVKDYLMPDSFQIYLDGNTVIASFSYSVEPAWFVYATLQCSDTKDGPYEDTLGNLFYYEMSEGSANIIRYTPKNSGGIQYYRLKCVDIYKEVYTESVELTLPMSTPEVIAPSSNDSNLPVKDDLMPDSFQIYLDGNTVIASFSYSIKPKWFVYATLQCSDTKDGPYESTGEYLFDDDLSTRTANIIKYIPKDSGGIKYYRLKCVDVGNEAYTEPTALTIPMAVPNWSKQSCAGYVSCNKISWEWSNDAASYLIYRSKNRNSGFKKIAEVKNPTISSEFKMRCLCYYDSKLSPNRMYYYRIAAVSKNGIKSGVGETYSIKTGKKPKAYGKKAVLPNFKSYAGISGKSFAQKNIYGIRQKVIYYSKVTEDMYNGYVKLLKKKTYQLKACTSSSGECSYDYKGGVWIVRGSAVNTGSDAYGASYDLTVSYNSSTKIMKLTLSPSFKLKNVAKGNKYKKRSNPSSNQSNNQSNNQSSGYKSNNSSSGSHSNGSGTKFCYMCAGTGKCGSCNGRMTCPVCFGRGGMSYATYGQGGSGWVVCQGCHGTRKCPKCGGSGRCGTCGGSGKR